MNNKRISILFILIILLNSCSFDSKTGIWGDAGKEKKKIAKLQKEQKEVIKVEKIYSSENIFTNEIPLRRTVTIPKEKRNFSWMMPNLNYHNFLGNIYLSGIDSVFLKKKIGKDKFSTDLATSSILAIKNDIIFSDDNGSIFKINENGKVIWKKNIYRKAYKKVYKSLIFSIYKDNIYVADNIGFVYSINLNDGRLLWIKNYEVPIKSNIKVFDSKIFLVNQDNKISCLNTKDGSSIWNIFSAASFIKSKNLLSLAIAEEKYLIVITSSADVYKINIQNGNIIWSRNTAGSLYADATDFFVSSEIVINENNIIFSSGKNTFSLNLNTAQTNWKQEVNSISTPIITSKNIFIVTSQGYLVILDKNTGEIISSSNILKVLKKKKQKTNINSFIMGSNKIYSITSNGFLIVTSASTGKTENFKKIGSGNISPLIINNGKLHMLIEGSKILILN